MPPLFDVKKKKRYIYGTLVGCHKKYESILEIYIKIPNNMLSYSLKINTLLFLTLLFLNIPHNM